MTGSSGRRRVQARVLERYLLPCPSPSVSKAFGSLVEPLFAKASANAGESRTLAELRDLLLPKLLSGELRVSQAEKVLAGV